MHCRSKAVIGRYIPCSLKQIITWHSQDIRVNKLNNLPGVIFAIASAAIWNRHHQLNLIALFVWEWDRPVMAAYMSNLIGHDQHLYHSTSSMIINNSDNTSVMESSAWNKYKQRTILPWSEHVSWPKFMVRIQQSRVYLSWTGCRKQIVCSSDFNSRRAINIFSWIGSFPHTLHTAPC